LKNVTNLTFKLKYAVIAGFTGVGGAVLFETGEAVFY